MQPKTECIYVERWVPKGLCRRQMRQVHTQEDLGNSSGGVLMNEGRMPGRESTSDTRQNSALALHRPSVKSYRGNCNKVSSSRKQLPPDASLCSLSRFGNNTVYPSITERSRKLLDHGFAHRANPTDALSGNELARPEQLSFLIFDIRFNLVRC